MLGRRAFLGGAAAFSAGLLAGIPAGPALASTDFKGWLDGVWHEARGAGVSRATFDTATRGLTPDPSIGKSASNQAEFVKPIWEYVERAVSDKRISDGRDKLKEYTSILDALEAVYGVQRHYVLAIWGMETSYGSYLGDKNVIRSLATLGYRGRRRKFGRSQLIAALKILERGDVTAERMNGSWAGAMGHTQFIPTTYNAYAVDFDGDGRRDIWNSIPDALASTANYLRVSRWQPGLPWGFEVAVPDGFDFARADGQTSRKISAWEGLGLSRPGGGRLPHREVEAKMLLPAGARGPVFLITPNFRCILRYNNASSYALSVGHLGDRIAGAEGFVQQWPVGDRPLARSERVELQRRLAQAGFSPGPADGVLGDKTRTAVRAYQRRIGAPPDGYASLKLLETLRQ
jgi:membrane-bound lytic murein transglycosylase B